MKLTFLQLILLVFALISLSYSSKQDELPPDGLEEAGGVEEAGGLEEAGDVSSKETETVPDSNDKSGRVHLIKRYQTQEEPPISQKIKFDEYEQGITEYSYSFWFKWDYLWKDDYKYNVEGTSEIIVANLVQKIDGQGYPALSTRINYQEQTSLRSFGYNHQGDSWGISSQQTNYLLNDLDNEWIFVYIGYNKSQQTLTSGFKFPGKQLEFEARGSVFQDAVSTKSQLLFKIASGRDDSMYSYAEKFSGFYKNAVFNYGTDGQGGFQASGEQVSLLIATFPNPIEDLLHDKVQLTIQLNDEGLEVNNISTTTAPYTQSISDISYPKQYSINGWYQVTTPITETQLLYRVQTKNFANSDVDSELGLNTLTAEINNNGELKFKTYSVSSGQPAVYTNTFSISQDQYENDFYIYHGYAHNQQRVVIYLQTYDSEEPQIAYVDNVVHLRSKDYNVSFGSSEGYTTLVQGVYSCINFEYGPNSVKFGASEINDLVQDSLECVQHIDGVEPVEGQTYQFESYNIANHYISHGNPSYISQTNRADIYLVEGLVGEIDETVSLKSALVEQGTERSNFYWRHIGGVIREMENDGSEDFQKSASWILHRDLFFENTISIESANKRGYFIRHQNSLLKLARLEDSDLYKKDASWILGQSTQPEPVTIDLFPIYHLTNSDKTVSALSIENSRINSLKDQGFTEYDWSEETKIVGWAFNGPWDSATVAIVEFVNPETNELYYTTNPDDVPEGFELNAEVFWAYPVNFERTLPVHQYSVPSETYFWITNQDWIDQASPANFVKKAFWVYQDRDICIDDIEDCGPIIPEACSHPHYYRESQEEDCKECVGEIIPYDHSLGNKSLYYTATCQDCIGGYYLDSEGVRKCHQCPDGYWVDDGAEDGSHTCYPNCNESGNYYVDPDTLVCVYCSGELVDSEREYDQLKVCQDCLPDETTNLLTCSDGSEVVEYNGSCPEGESVINSKQICLTCQLKFSPDHNYEFNSMTGKTECVKRCPQPNYYVDNADNYVCKPCNGLIYDDEAGNIHCTPYVENGPFETAHNNAEEVYKYQVPTDQVDDVKEFAFFSWIKAKFLTPSISYLEEQQANDARIGGFSTAEQTTSSGSGSAQVDISSCTHKIKLYTSNRAADYSWWASYLDGTEYRVDHQARIRAHIFGPSGGYLGFCEKSPEHSVDTWNNCLSTTALEGYSFYIQTLKDTDHTQWYAIKDSLETHFGLDVQAIQEHYDNASLSYDGFYAIGVVGAVTPGFDELILDEAGSSGMSREWCTGQVQYQAGSSSSGSSGDSFSIVQSKVDTSTDIDAEQYNIAIVYGEQREKLPIARQYYDNEWVLVYMAVKDQKFIGYTYAGGNGQLVTINNVGLELTNYLLFTLQNQHSTSSFSTYGFQGSYYTVNLRFAQTGLVHNSVAEVESYLSTTHDPVTLSPPIDVHYGVTNIFEANTVVDLTTKSQSEKRFTFENLKGTQEYAVYGWYRFHDIQYDHVLQRAVNFFNLQNLESSTTEQNWGVSPRINQQVLQSSYTDSKEISFKSESTNIIGAGTYTSAGGYSDSFYLDEETVSQWFWVYQSYNQQTNKNYGYISTLLGEEEVVIDTTKDIPAWYFRTDRQQLDIGQTPYTSDSFRQDNLDGDVFNLKIEWGDACDVESDRDCVSGKRNASISPTPEPFGQCVIMYDQPQYQGQNWVWVCYEEESFDLDISSIYIPEGVEFKIWNQANFEGLTIIYTESQSSISTIDFTLLLEGKVKGMKVMENDAYHNFMAKKNNTKQSTDNGDDSQSSSSSSQQGSADDQQQQPDQQQTEQTQGSSDLNKQERPRGGGRGKQKQSIPKKKSNIHLRNNKGNKKSAFF